MLSEKDLVIQQFPWIFAAMLPFNSSDSNEEKEKAIRVLQESFLRRGGVTEIQRDELISQHMVRGSN